MGNKTINKKLDIMLWKYKSLAKKKREKNPQIIHKFTTMIVQLL